MTKRAQQLAAFVFGVIFVAAMLVIAVALPNPSVFQYTVFRVVLALAAAGVAAMVPGFLQVTISDWLRAGGALAVFAVVYFFNPAELVSPSNPSPPLEGKEARIERVQVLKSSHENEYPFEFVLTNPTTKNLLITEIRVHGNYDSGMRCEGDIQYLAMAVNFRAEASENVPSGNATPGFQAIGTGTGNEGGDVGYPIVGRMYDYCTNIGLSVQMPINLILQPNSRKILRLNLKEGEYGAKRVEWGGRFFLTVGSLHDYLVAQATQKAEGSKTESSIANLQISTTLDQVLWGRAVSAFLQKQDMDLQFSKPLGLWRKIRTWTFEMIVGKNESVLIGEIQQ